MKKIITVINEGCNEEHYINVLLKILNFNSHISVVFENFHGGSPKKALEKYEFLLADSERDVTDNYLVVFDEDKPDAFRYKKAIEKSEPKKNTLVFTTNPCFEAFLLAHFEENINELQKKCNAKTLIDAKIRTKQGILTKTPISICYQCETYLKYKEYIPGYSKDCLFKLSSYIDQTQIKLAKNQCENFKELLEYIININSK